jgi:large subunit ribosomal protein L4
MFLKALELENKNHYFVLGASNKNVYLSSRNLKAASVVSSLE